MNDQKLFFIKIIMVGALTILVGPSAFAQYYWIHHTTLVLVSIPHSIEQGHHVIFSGKLLTSDDKTPLPNRTVFIQYDSPYDHTRTLTSATTDINGNFAVSWTAVPKGFSGGTYYLFAKFNGDDWNFWSISKQFPLNVIPKYH